MVVTFDSALSNFLKLFTIWPHRSLLKILFINHKWSILCLVISQEVSHECHGFLFSECRCKRKRFRLRSLVGRRYVSFNVIQQNLFETFVIFFQRHLLASQLKSVEFVWKKIPKEFSEFCNIIFYFMICYSCHEVSSLQPIFTIFYLPTFTYK